MVGRHSSSKWRPCKQRIVRLSDESLPCCCCCPWRCEGAVGAIEGLKGPSVRQAAGSGRLHIRGTVCGASSKKLRGCRCGGAKHPCFGFPGNKRPSCCVKCKLEGMIDIKHPRCNCGRARPFFGMPEDTRPSCCAECKLEGMVDIISRKCNCGRAIPCFGMLEDARASCCAECKLEGMVDIIHRKCNCGRAIPCFGMPEDARPSCCVKCKLEGMVDIIHRKCNCGRVQPYFGMPEDARPSCCAECKLENMINIISRKCNCGRARPSFGMTEDTRPSCCAECKLENMINIISRKCNCGRARPSFGMPEDTRPSCCAECKLENMINIISRKCNCGRARPSCGMPEDTRPSCCAECKLEGMVDIISRRCSVCGKLAAYPDAAGVPRQLCAAHSAEVGAHVLSSPSWSRAASEFLDLLEEERGFEFPFRHRFDEAAGEWSGEEFVGLVPDRALRPDAHDPGRGEVVEFLGNYYHGFPPKHPEQLGCRQYVEQHHVICSLSFLVAGLFPCLMSIVTMLAAMYMLVSNALLEQSQPVTTKNKQLPVQPRHLSFTCVGGKTSPELHRQTFERLDLFLAQGLRVFYVWEHDFVEWQKLAAWLCQEQVLRAIGLLQG